MSWALRYERTLRHLASHGFVVLAPMTADHQTVPRAWEFAQTLLGALQFAAAESARPSSLLAGRVDVTRAGCYGHSMGAGSALVAAALSADSSYAASLGNRIDWPWGTASLLDFDSSRAAWPQVRAFIGLGVFPPTAPLTGFAPLRARTLFIVPEGDRFVPPEAQRALWNALPAATPRTLALLRAASHCWLDEPAPGAGWGYPVSQCDMAEANAATYMPPRAQARARAAVTMTIDRSSLLRRAHACIVVHNLCRAAAILTPRPCRQVNITRKFVAAYFTATLAQGADDVAAATQFMRAMQHDALLQLTTAAPAAT
jgi:hypothetical protein